MTDALFDVDGMDPGTPALHPDYRRWPVTVHATIPWWRGPSIEGDALSDLICGCLEAWGVVDPQAGDVSIICDPDTGYSTEALHHQFSGQVPGRTLAHSNEVLRQLIDQALDVLNADWERIDRMAGGYRRYRPPKG